MTPEALVAVTEEFPTAEVSSEHGDVVARVPRDDVVGFMDAVRAAGYDLFLDLCAVDYLTRDPRFEIAINVVSPAAAERLRVLIGISGEDPRMGTITGVYPGANFYEREAFDLFGIEFQGHPDLSRILLPDEWVGHPLRKDSPVGSVPVQFKEANKVT